MEALFERADLSGKRIGSVVLPSSTSLATGQPSGAQTRPTVTIWLVWQIDVEAAPAGGSCRPRCEWAAATTSRCHHECRAMSTRQESGLIPAALRKKPLAHPTRRRAGPGCRPWSPWQYRRKSPHGRPAPIEPWGEWRTSMARWKFSLPPPEQIIRKAFVVRPAELPREDCRPYSKRPWSSRFAADPRKKPIGEAASCRRQRSFFALTSIWRGKQ
jgi:hypothetical protein